MGTGSSTNFQQQNFVSVGTHEYEYNPNNETAEFELAIRELPHCSHSKLTIKGRPFLCSIRFLYDEMIITVTNAIDQLWYYKCSPEEVDLSRKHLQIQDFSILRFLTCVHTAFRHGCVTVSGAKKGVQICISIQFNNGPLSGKRRIIVYKLKSIMDNGKFANEIASLLFSCYDMMAVEFKEFLKIVSTNQPSEKSED